MEVHAGYEGETLSEARPFPGKAECLWPVEIAVFILYIQTNGEGMWRVHITDHQNHIKRELEAIGATSRFYTTHWNAFQACPFAADEIPDRYDL